MIVNSAPENLAILSNVSGVGEFRIKSSSRAFQILSSSLYANKIRAIIRELSCNALDSHTAAGNPEVPFDLHIPTKFEPWFSIRDYGTGLTDKQVIDIYTTYFESTKTDSNDFIGALGLGSKTPFSYTETFTVTAYKDGVCCIYSAFINEVGIPSVALMGSFQTEESNGVEIKFAVENQNDFYKFANEAGAALSHFKVYPNFTGDKVYPTKYNYIKRDLIDGVHYRESNYGYSVAVMGNIEYPIDIPVSNQHQSYIYDLLKCNLEIHFPIGELDFQASREGLSYIPSTVKSIVDKLEKLNLELSSIIDVEYKEIESKWDKALFLRTKYNQTLFAPTTRKYAESANNPFISLKSSYPYLVINNIELTKQDSEKLYNIEVVVMHTNSHNVVKTSRYTQRHKNFGNGFVYVDIHNIYVADHIKFIINDSKKKPLEQVRWNMRKDKDLGSVILLNKVDQDKEMDVDGFLKSIHNPPARNILKLSSLQTKPPIQREKIVREVNVGIMKPYCSKWESAGFLNDFSSIETYYYSILSNSRIKSDYFKDDGYYRLHDLTKKSGIPGLQNIIYYGVRKSALKEIQKKSNWINVDEHILKCIADLPKDFVMRVAVKDFINSIYAKFLSYSALDKLSPNSEFAKYIKSFKSIDCLNNDIHCMNTLIRLYSPETVIPVDDEIAKLQDQENDIKKKYPLIQYLTASFIPECDKIQYINQCDSN